MTDTTHPSRRAGLRDELRRAVCEAEGFVWDSDMLEPDEYGDHADTVLAVLYREWPWLRAEAEDTASAVVPAADRAAVLEEAAAAVAADTGFHIRYGAAVDYAEHYAALLRRMAAESAAVDRVAAETPPAETERRLTRVREWATSDVVTARNGFGSGYREAQRDILDLIDGPGPVVEAQPGKDTETPQPKEA